MAEGNDYIKSLVMVFLALGSFIIAILAAYFGAVGLYFGKLCLSIQQCVVKTPLTAGNSLESLILQDK